MDTIDVELEIGTRTHEDGTVGKFQYIHLVLNGKRISAPFDCFRLIYSTSFKRTVMELTTCGCGNAGCAGVFYGSKIKRKARSVEVTRIDDQLPNRFYRFPLQQWDDAVTKTIELLYKLAYLRETEGYNGYEGPDEYDGIFGFNSRDEVTDRLDRGLEWTKRHEQNYEHLLRMSDPTRRGW